MTPTLDTAAIRKRFEQAIIGIRQDGTMAVLVPLINARCLDLVRGDRYSPTRLQSHFVSLIRPGDRVEVSDGDGYEIAVYRGVTGGTLFPFSAVAWDSDDPDGDTYRYIRPLLAAETKAKPTYTMDDFRQGRICADFRHIPETEREAAFKKFLARCGGMKWNLGQDATECVPNTVFTYILALSDNDNRMTHALDGYGTYGTIPVRPENIVDCPDHAAILSRIEAAEREIAAARAALGEVRK